jgi:hypothetical protein
VESVERFSLWKKALIAEKSLISPVTTLVQSLVLRNSKLPSTKPLSFFGNGGRLVAAVSIVRGGLPA